MLSISLEDQELLLASGLFDPAWYIRTYPDVAMVGMDALEHYLWLGTLLGRDPSEHFSVVSYLSRHPDVAGAGVNPLLHYLKWGKAEGRIIDPRPKYANRTEHPSDPEPLVADLDAKLPVPFLYRSPPAWVNPRIGVFARGNLKGLEQAIGAIRSLQLPFSFHVVTTAEESRQLQTILANWGHGKLAIEASDDIEERDAAWDDFARTSLEFDYALFIDLDRSDIEAGCDRNDVRLPPVSPDTFWSIVTAFHTDDRLGFLSASPARVVSAGKLDPELVSLASAMGVSLDQQSTTPLSPPIFWARCSALRPLVTASASAESKRAPCSALLLAYTSGEVGAFRHAVMTQLGHARTDVSIRNAETLIAATRRASSRSLSKAAFLNPIGDAEDGSTRLSANRAAFKQARLAELDAFLKGDRDLELPTSERPIVSIIVALYNSAELSLPFLESLRSGMAGVPCELILVDNASTDATRALLRRVHGARVILNDENVHFLRAVNAGAEIARGEHILLLNNDTVVPEDAIGIALTDLEDRSIGAVGGKLILPDGSLQEAGSIIWDDGSCAGFGRYCNPYSPIFQFMRDVDFCSGAFLMFRRDLFEQLGGLDDKYAPAYYEETDLCMRIRGQGLRIVYDPRIAVQHFEFGSASTSQQAIDLQIRNRRIFSETHRSVLKQRHFAPNQEIIRAANAGDAPRILYLDDRVPFQEYGSGFPRSREIVIAIHEAGWDITIFPMTFPESDFVKVWANFPVGVEIAGELGRDRLAEFLQQRRGYYDAIMASRPHNMALLSHAIDKVGGYENTPIIYDAEAIFVEREAIRRKLHGIPFDEVTYQAELRDELSITKGATIITAVSERERGLFETKTGIACRSLGHKFASCPSEAPFTERRDILFVGALTGAANFSPNIDSLHWFVQKVMPLLDERIGRDWRLVVAGHVDSPEASALASDRVHLLGMVPDLAELFNGAKIFIAPTRFAAGIPIKAIEAASRGLPIVSSGLIASQLGFTSGEHLLAADTPKLYAEGCADLYRNEALWRKIRHAALDRIERDYSAAAFDLTVQQILASLPVNHDRARSSVFARRRDIEQAACPNSISRG